MVQENIRLSLISTKMEDALALSPILNEGDLRSLDATYVEWFQSSSVQNTLPVAGEPYGIRVLRNLMRWRYLWHRVTIHRPHLLWYITQKEALHQLGAEKRAAVEACYAISAQLIEDIASTWESRRPCQFAGWNATWMIYQAAMTPLLCLFCEFSDATSIQNSQRLVELALKTLTDLQPWFSTAKRSFEVLNWLYSASTQGPSFEQPISKPLGPNQPGASPSIIRAQEEPVGDGMASVQVAELPLEFSAPLPNDFFGSLGWSTDWDTTMTDFDIPGISLDYDAELPGIPDPQGQGVYLPVFDASHNEEEEHGI